MTAAGTDTIDFGRRLRRAVEALEYLVLSLPLGVALRGARRAARARRGAQRALDRPAARAGRARRLRAAGRGRAPPGQPPARRAHRAAPRRRRATRHRGGARSASSPTARSGACWRCSCSSCRSRVVGLAAGLSRSRSPSWLLDLRRPRHRRPATGVSSARGRSARRSASLLCLLALPAGDRRDRRARGPAARLLRALAARAAAPARAAGGPGARDARRAPRRPLAVHRLLAARARDLRRRARPPGALPEPGSGRAWTAVERDGVRVAAIVHDAELDAGAGARQRGRRRRRAGDRQRAPEGRPARARRGAARLAPAHRRGRRRRPPPDRARPPRRRPAAARLARARPAAAEGEARTTTRPAGDGRRARREARRPRSPSCASSRAASIPSILSERGLVPAVDALAERAPLPVECRHLDRRAARRRRSRPRPTSWSPRV